MKIVKFVKLTNQYKLIFDNKDELKLYDDTIIKFNLLSHNELDDNSYKEVVSYNDRIGAYYKAIKYITLKLRTRFEIRKYLSKDYTKEVINNVIKRLEDDGYINDELYLKSYINDTLNLTNFGPNRIKRELLKLEFSEDVISARLSLISDDKWVSKIDNYIDKKVRLNHTNSNNILKKKLQSDLINLGYYKEMIDEELSKLALESDKDLLIKEYNKIKKNLEKKYSGYDLELKLKQKLMTKGFKYDDINEIVK